MGRPSRRLAQSGALVPANTRSLSLRPLAWALVMAWSMGLSSARGPLARGWRSAQATSTTWPSTAPWKAAAGSRWRSSSPPRTGLRVALVVAALAGVAVAVAARVAPTATAVAATSSTRSRRRMLLVVVVVVVVGVVV